MSKFYPGAKAVIVVSEWERNIGRVVTIIAAGPHDTRWPLWCVEDGGMFQGWTPQSTHDNRVEIEHKTLAIAEWKLRPLLPTEPTFKIEELEYVS
jgi:hypothetical protein